DLRLQFDHGARVAVQKNNRRQGWFADRFVLRLSQPRSKFVLPRPVPIETGLPDRALVRSQRSPTPILRTEEMPPSSSAPNSLMRGALAVRLQRTQPGPPRKLTRVANSFGTGLFLR